MDLNFNVILKCVGALIVSVGGTSVFVFVLSKWFGSVLANKLLEKDKAKYQLVLENKKVELDNIKASMIRYSENQFFLYNELWGNLVDLREKAVNLWSLANNKNLKDFSSQLRETKTAIEKSRLLIEDEHYTSLKEIINEFSSFQIGKIKLIDVRNKTVKQLLENEVNENSIKSLIDRNHSLNLNYSNLLENLAKAFKRQIRGDNAS